MEQISPSLQKKVHSHMFEKELKSNTVIIAAKKMINFEANEG